LAHTNKNIEPPKSANFRFLAKRYPDLDRIGAGCERYFSDDPVVALILLRQFGEVLAQMLAARSGLLTDAREPQADLLRRLRVEGNYPPSVMELFHQLRKSGNAATHNRDGDHASALSCLKMARQLAIWFYRTFDDQNFKPGAFEPPRAPVDATVEVKAELQRLKAEKEVALTEAQRAKERIAEAEAAGLAAEEGAKGTAEERDIYAQLAVEAEAAKNELGRLLAQLQAGAAASRAPTQDNLRELSASIEAVEGPLEARRIIQLIRNLRSSWSHGRRQRPLAQLPRNRRFFDQHRQQRRPLISTKPIHGCSSTNNCASVAGRLIVKTCDTPRVPDPSRAKRWPLPNGRPSTVLQIMPCLSE
jgi:hypothetical protein